jgi:hypothetical protein
MVGDGPSHSEPGLERPQLLAPGRAAEQLRGLPGAAREWILDAPRHPELIALAVIVLLGVALRTYLFIRWRPALVGFPDSTTYLQMARTGIFDNPLRVGGYSEFLRVMHAIRAHLSFAIAVQHALGIASGLLLYATMRRIGGPRWLGLVPAAAVILVGSEIFIEHAPLGEALFIFLIDLALYALVRCWRGGASWAALGGLCLGLATDVRVVGQAAAAVMILIAALVAPMDWRGRGIRFALAVVTAVLPIAYYVHEREVTAHRGGFTSTGYFDLYSRVAPFAECSKFHPPPDLRALCIETPRSQRDGHDYWEYTTVSPAFRLYGDPDVNVAPQENAHLRAFAIDAILGQPLRYLEYVGRDMVRVIDPSFSSSPYPRIGNLGYGNTPASLLNYYFAPQTSAGAQVAIAAYYPGDGIVHGDISGLEEYERATRLEGPVMALLLALALAAPFVTRGLERRGAVLLLATSAVLLLAPILASEYDYRFVIPAFGPLAATAALGGWGVAWRLSVLRSHPSPHPG